MSPCAPRLKAREQAQRPRARAEGSGDRLVDLGEIARRLITAAELDHGIATGIAISNFVRQVQAVKETRVTTVGRREGCRPAEHDRRGDTAPLLAQRAEQAGALQRQTDNS